MQSIPVPGQESKSGDAAEIQSRLQQLLDLLLVFLLHYYQGHWKLPSVLKDFLCYMPFHSENCHMPNKNDFSFVCTYTDWSRKESRIHGFHMQFQGTLVLSFQLQLSETWRNFLTWICYPHSGETHRLIWDFIEFHKGKHLPESAVVIFFLMKKARHFAFYTYMGNRLCFSEP